MSLTDPSVDADAVGGSDAEDAVDADRCALFTPRTVDGEERDPGYVHGVRPQPMTDLVFGCVMDALVAQVVGHSLLFRMCWAGWLAAPRTVRS